MSHSQYGSRAQLIIGQINYKHNIMIMEQQHKWLLKKFHTLCSKLKLTPAEKKAIVLGCGVESSKDIDNHQLMDLCHKLEMQLIGDNGESNILRKRVMAAIGNWLKLEGRESNADIIKGIACRATGYDTFNKIPVERLRNIYNAFVKKSKDSKAVAEMADFHLMKALAGVDDPKRVN